MRRVVPSTLGGIHQDELLAIHDSYEAENVRALRPVFFQVLDFPIPQVSTDCLVQSLFDVFSRDFLPPSGGGCPVGMPYGADDACGKVTIQEKSKLR